MAEETRVLPLRTHTSLWKLEKRIYRVYDVNLPVPVSMRTLGVGLAASIPYWLLLSLLHFPFVLNGWVIALWIGPPVGLAYMANRPLAEGKTLTELAISQFLYVGQPHTYARLRPFDQPTTKKVHGFAWQERPASHNQSRKG